MNLRLYALFQLIYFYEKYLKQNKKIRTKIKLKAK